MKDEILQTVMVIDGGRDAVSARADVDLWFYVVPTPAFTAQNTPDSGFKAPRRAGSLKGEQ